MIDEWQREVEKGCARWGEVVPPPEIHQRREATPPTPPCVCPFKVWFGNTYDGRSLYFAIGYIL